MSMFILALGILIFLSYFFSSLFEKTKVPDVLLLMILGIVAGPFLGVMSPGFFGEFGNVLTTLALIVILFEGGTTIDLKTLGQSIGPAMMITLLTFLATMAIGFGFSMVVLRFEILPALMLGAIIGGTSSAVVVPMVQGLNMKEPASTILILESAITDVLCIVLVAAMIDVHHRGGSADGQIAGSILSSLVFAVVIGLTGGLGWLFIISKVDRFRRSMFSTVAAVLIGFGVAEQFGFSGAITALSFGSTLTNFKSFRFERLPLMRKISFAVISEQEKNFYREIVFLLKTFFFLFLGLSIRFESILSFAAALGLVVIIYAARMVICRFTVSRKIQRKEVSLMSIMVPKGLAAAVLAGMPLQAGVSGGDVIRNVVYAVILISIVLTAVLVPLFDKTRLQSFYYQFFSAFAQDISPVTAAVITNEPAVASATKSDNNKVN